ncbi:MAG: autotransporter domain-containing protein, partial [Fusobacterium ulcerans]|nr:autotransporter domain-containing protein [Fusobacterium ulcerans]
MEKIMRLVKSGNKKRGRNITVGAVVGMLLSCTSVMGADEYLWIKNDGGAIKFSTDNSTPASIENPYGENTWNETEYVNNITLNSTSTDYGLKLEGDLGNVNFTNNGLIRATRNGSSYGIYNSSGSKIGNIKNNGSITGTSTGSRYDNNGNGICNKGTIGDITNRGLIIGTNTGSDGNGYGICNDFGSSKIENIINSGLIAGIGKRSSKGIWICGGTNINSIYNIGLIIGVGDSNQGIYIQGNIAKDLINDGVISSLDLTSDVSNYVIYIYEKTPIIKNNGLMIGRKNGSEGAYGIFNQTTAGRHIRAINTGSIINTNDGTGNAAGIRNINGSANDFYIANSGLISGATTGSGNGYGIYNESNATRNNYAEIEAIVNTGVIYGETTAIKNLESLATITSIDNYGILATEGNSSIDNTTGGTITNTPTNYGLYIEGTTGIVTIDPSKVNASPIDIVVRYSNDDDYVTNEIKRNMTIKNAELEGASGSATATKSITFSGTE